MSSDLDDVDFGILYSLQEDARRNTNADVAERVGVSATTVRKRIRRMEEAGVIQGYAPTIDYELAGFPLRVLFVCTAPISERERLVRGVLDVEGVVSVDEIMSGRQNVHAQVVAHSNDAVTRIARRLDEIGLEVVDEVLVRSEYARPSVRFETANEE